MTRSPSHPRPPAGGALPTSSAAPVGIAIVTVSDTRTRATDRGGDALEELAREAGWVVVARTLVPDGVASVRTEVLRLLDGAEGAVGLPSDDGQQESAADAPERSAGGQGSRRAPKVDIVVVTGGTGIASRDLTVEAVSPLFERTIDGFGELFRALSFEELGPAAMLSRACAGVVQNVPVFLLPGSPGAVRLAMSRLIVPMGPHLRSELARSVGESHVAPDGAGRPGHHLHPHDHARDQHR